MQSNVDQGHVSFKITQILNIPDIYGFLPIPYIIGHLTALFIIVVNGTETHKYLDHPYCFHKCLNVGWMSIFYFIFLYIFPRNLY